MSYLSEKRQAKGYSQAQLAEAAGVHENTIQRLESTGIENAAIKSVIPIARVLECDIDTLVFGEKDFDRTEPMLCPLSFIASFNVTRGELMNPQECNPNCALAVHDGSDYGCGMLSRVSEWASETNYRPLPRSVTNE